MGRKLKKGKAGNAAQYLTRTHAIRKLQLRLGEFRRLCILKGIHPREPKKKVHGANKTYYHIKDINFLLHEPLLQTFRNLKAYDKKVKKAKAKQNLDLAQRLQALKPGYKVDHLVKERYPSFVDAIRDLDDPLTMVHLFATLPAEKKYNIPTKAVHMARRLSMEFNAYVVRTNALRRVFVSIKGFYYQAEILGQSVTWLVPHQLAQVLPVDVDYRVMLTFLEFYETMLQFVNFKLYHMIGLRYPPAVDRRMESAAEELVSIMKDLAGVREAVDQQVQEQHQQLEQLEAQEASKREQRAGAGGKGAAKGGAAKEGSDEEESEEVDSEDDGQDDDAVLDIDSGDEDEDEASICGSLFKGLVFFLAREVPREPLLLVIRAFGGAVAWDGEGSPMKESDEAITHQIVDRPTQGHRFLSRKYVQPQWVLDSANFRVLMPSDLYTPGKVPPPHLSPFVDNDQEGYTPDFAVTIKQLQEAAKAARLRYVGGKADANAFVAEDEAAVLAPGATAAQDVETVEKEYLADLAKELAGDEVDKEEEKGEEDDEEVDEEAADEKKEKKVSKKRGAAEVEDEEQKMKDIMMTRKNRKLYERIKRSQEGKRERIEVLEKRKRAIENGTKPAQTRSRKA